MSFTSLPPITTTSETITGLTPNTSYDVQVFAENAVGSSSPTQLVTIVTASATSAPSQPTNLASTSIATTTVNLSWTASTGTAPITYQVQQSPTGTNTWTNSGSSVSITNAQVTGLTSSTGYDFRVIATNSIGMSIPSAVLTDVVTLAVSQTVTWKTVGTSSITLSNSNLTATAGGSTVPYAVPQGAISTLANGTGSYWFEVQLSSITQNCSMGLAGSAMSVGVTGGGADANSIAFYPSTGPSSQPAQTVYFNGAQVLTPSGNAPAADIGSMLWGANGHIDQGGPYTSISLSQQATDLKTVFGTGTVLYRAGLQDDLSPATVNADATTLQAAGITTISVIQVNPNFAGYANESAAYTSTFNAVATFAAGTPAVKYYEIGNEWVINGLTHAGDGSVAANWTGQALYPIARGITAGAVAAIRANNPSAKIIGGALAGWTFLGLAPALAADLVSYATPSSGTKNLTWDYTCLHWYNDAYAGGNDMGLPDNFNGGMNAYTLLKGAGKPLMITEFGSSNNNNSANDTQAGTNLAALMANFLQHKQTTATEPGVVGGQIYQLYQQAGAQTDYFLYHYTSGPTGTIATQGTAVETWVAANPSPTIFTFLVNINQTTGSGTLFVTGPAMQASYGAIAWNDSATANPGASPPIGGIPFTIAGNLSILFETDEGGSAAILNAGSSAPSRVIPSAYLAWNGTITTVTAPTAPQAVTAGLGATAVFFDDFLTKNISWTAWDPNGGTGVMATPGNGAVVVGGDTWTITAGGLPQKNGATQGGGSQVLGLWNVGGTIWTFVLANVWYSWSGSAWVLGNAPVGFAWLDSYPFFANQYHLPAVDEREFMCSSQQGYYSSTAYQPFSIANSTLSIKAQSVASSGIPNVDGQAWNSGTMSSCQYVNGGPSPGLFDFLFGYVEGLFQWPDGGPTNSPGYWPQFVLYPLDGVGPDEIDIFEGLSGSVTTVRQTLHSTSGVTFFTATAAMDTGFHRIGVDWQADFITFYVDGVQTGQLATPSDMKKRMYINCGNAVAGPASWSGTPFNTNPADPGSMQVGYIGAWTNFAAVGSGITSTTVNISWKLPATGTQPITYTVQQSPHGANTWTNSTTTNNVTNAVVSGLTPSTAYDFRVLAGNSAGTSAASGTVSATTLNSSVLPGAPSGVGAVANSTTQITVTWQPTTTGGPVGGTSGGYQVLFRKTGTSPFATFVSIPVVTPANGSFSALGGTWSVSAAGVVAFTGAGGPGISSGVTQLTEVNGTVWQFNGTNWYGTTTPGSWPLGGTPTVPWSVPVTGLVINTSYDFEITASNPSGTGAASSPIVSASTLASAPANVFTVSGGKVMRNGAAWICRGVVNYFIDNTGGAGNASTTIADHQTIAGNFPGINTFKAGLLADHTYNDVLPYITDWVTNNGCVLIIANYKYGAQYQINSGNFASDAATFSSIARGAIGNANVWFESENEAQNGGGPGSGQTVDDEHLNHYNAVRNLVQFTGSSSGTTLTVTGVTGGTIVTGMVINPIANSSVIPLHTSITSQTSGTAGGAGTYVTSNPTTASGTALTAGNGNIVVFCSVAGNPFYPNSTPSQQGTASYYSNMYNVIWDDHWYGTGNGVQSTGPNDTLNAPGDFGSGASQNSISVRLAGFNNFATSLDGQIPVGAFEWGDAAAGANGPHNYSADNQQIAALKAVCNACVGSGHAGFAGMTAWQYGSYAPSVGGDVLINSSTGTRYQQSDQYAEIIAYCIANPNTVNTQNYGFVGGPS